MLTLRQLRKSFGTTLAVDGLTLEIRRGEVFGLLGPNGAGKTTTINMITGLLHPDAGGIELHTSEGVTDPRLPAARRHLGVAPQTLALYEDLSAQENLWFFGRLFGLGGEALRTRVRDVLNQVGLGPRGGDRVRAYSGGMKRRLNLAAAIVHDPPLLLLDEPTAGVDPQSRNNILDLVRELKRQGRTIVYTTHYMEEAQRLCDRVGIVDQGRLLALGTVDDLLAQHGGRTTVTVMSGGSELRVETDDPVAEIAARLHGGDEMSGLRLDRPDLESVFLHLTGRRLRD